MDFNVPGLIVMILFYLLVLGTGIWASRKSKRVEKRFPGKQTEVLLLASRRINVLVGIFTMTGKCYLKCAQCILLGYILGYILS